MNIANLLLRVTGDEDDAKRALREVSAEMEAVAARHFDATMDVSTTEAKAKLKQLEASLTIMGARTTNHRVKIDVDNAKAKLALLRKELEHALTPGAVGARAVSAIVGDIGKLASQMGGATARAAGLAGKIADVGAAGGEAGTKLAGSLAGALLSVIGMVIQLAVVSVVLVAVMNVLAGLAIAVGSALFYAALGGGALALAFGAMLVPALIGAVLGFKAVVDAVKSVKEAEDKAKQTAEALTAAQKTREQAARSLADAQKSASDTYRDALRAERDAVNEVRDAELARENAKLGIEDAAIRRDRARLALKEASNTVGANTDLGQQFKRFSDVDYRATPKDLASARKAISSSSTLDDAQKLDLRQKLQDLAHAEVGVKEARQQSKTSAERLSDAQQKLAEFTRDGTKAYGPYESALRQVADAQRNFNEANKDYLKAQGENTDAQDKLNGKQVGLGRAFIEAGKEIKNAFGPATKGFVKGLLSVVQDFADLVSDPEVKKGISAIGEGFGYAFQQLGKLLRTREMRGIFRDIAREAGKMIGVIGGDIIPKFLTMVLRIARIAAPLLVDMLRGVGRLFGRWERGTREPKFKKEVERVVDAFKNLMGLVGDVLKLVYTLFKGGRDEGENLVTTLRRIVRQWTKFLDSDEGQQKIKEFVKQAIQDGKDFAAVLKTWYDTFNDILGVVRETFEVIGKVKKFLGAPGNFIQNKLGIGDGRTNSQNTKNSINSAGEVIESFAKEHPGANIVHHRKSQLDTVYQNLIAKAEDGGGGLSKSDAKKIINQLIKDQHLKGAYAQGGLVPGVGGGGDDGLIAAEGGEFMIKRDAVRALGVPALRAINSGSALPALVGAGVGGKAAAPGVHVDTVKIEAPPATYPSPHWVAQKLGTLTGAKVQ